MSEAVGRAGFNVRHLRHGSAGTRTERASILRESMRELDDDATAFYARNNPNIIAADTHLNVAMVNDGQGGFRAAQSTAEVLAYGDARIGTRQNAKGEDRVGNTGRIWNPRSFETTLIVAALPRSMCVEVPDVYPVKDADGNAVLRADGQQVMRSRWVPRDRAEALQYFAQTAQFLADEVLTGGHDAIHGYDVNFDESYPHLQLMADTLAPNSKKAGELRVEAQQMWGVSREVRDAKTGKVEQGKAKVSRYQEAYRAHMISLGYEVEAEASSRSKSSHSREEWAELQERERAAEELDRQAGEDLDLASEQGRRNRRRAEDLDDRERKLGDREDAVRVREQKVSSAESALIVQRQKIREREEAMEAQAKQLRKENLAKGVELNRREDLLIQSEQLIAELDAAYREGLAEMERQSIKPTRAAVSAKKSIGTARAIFRATRAEQLRDDASRDAGSGLGG